MKAKGESKKAKAGRWNIFNPLRLLSLLCISLSPFAFYHLPSLAAHSDSSEARLAVFDDAWETVHERYYDPSFHGVDWEAERAKFRPLAARAQTSAELYGVLRQMLGDLHDAHTRVFAPEEKFDWQHPRYISVGLSVREVEGLPVVVSVERGSEAERAGLRAGDVVLTIDNETAADVFARRLKELGGSSTLTAAHLQAMARLFEGTTGTTVNLRWLGLDGKEHTTNLKREWRERDATLKVRRLSDGIRLVEFDIFTQATATDFMAALNSRLLGAHGLIIDLRNNGGGEAGAMAEIASAFLPSGKSLGRFKDRTGTIQIEPRTLPAMFMSAATIKYFRAPLIILTSERTSSAAEIFVAALRESRRAEVIGQNTCGCVLAIRHRHTLPDGGELDVSEMDYYTAAGTRLEGAGLAPDEIIPLTRPDLRARRDRTLERAIERLAGEKPNG